MNRGWCVRYWVGVRVPTTFNPDFLAFTAVTMVVRTSHAHASVEHDSILLLYLKTVRSVALRVAKLNGLPKRCRVYSARKLTAYIATPCTHQECQSHTGKKADLHRHPRQEFCFMDTGSRMHRCWSGGPACLFASPSFTKLNQIVLYTACFHFWF